MQNSCHNFSLLFKKRACNLELFKHKGLTMKKQILAGLCLSLLAIGCQNQVAKPKDDMSRPMQPMQQKDDQNYEQRRKDMKKRSNGGCCEAEETKDLRSEIKETAEAQEIKEKSE